MGKEGRVDCCNNSNIDNVYTRRVVNEQKAPVSIVKTLKMCAK
jgi:hypothetical protein